MIEAAAQAKARGPQTPTFGRERLTPGAYFFDLEAVKDIPLKYGEEPSTFAAVYCNLRKAKAEKTADAPSDSLYQDEYMTEHGKVVISAAVARLVRFAP